MKPTAPARFCDLVMKGGITSGVVYPLAACELAKVFQFKNIGGTSAGAIAAAATAAAEFGRNSPEGGFNLLNGLPAFLGGKSAGDSNSNLFHFFEPQPGTKPVFDVCVAGLGGGWQAAVRVLGAASLAFWPWLLAGALPGAGFICWAVFATHGLFLAGCAILGLLFALVLALLAVSVGLAGRFVRTVPGNFFGLCSGMPATSEGSRATGQEPAGTAGPTALTPWLTQYLNRLAGLPPDGPPLTFGDLWGTKDPSAVRKINLEMMTTCLSHGRPYRLPFRNDEFVREDGQFYFHSAEFRQLFPETVVAWMEQHPRAARKGDSAERQAEFLKAGLHPLPEPCDLPVVVAVRMSLSFPVLLSAVPLHAVDFGRTDPANRTPERCWFSDGGISSNFPVHFFDSLLPRWPTFAISLAEVHPDHGPGPWLPSTNSPGTERWNRFDHDASVAHRPLSGLAQLAGFFGAILNSMQNWADNTQARLPGYRDRIATISLTKDEGGLNLNMPKPRIDTLAGYGRDAGAEFAQRFASPAPGSKLDWPNHRWVRLRSALASLEETILRLDTSCADPLPPDQPYDQWVRTADNNSVPSYPWVACGAGNDWKSQRALASDTLAALRHCAEELRRLNPEEPCLATGAPRPRPELRIRPRI